MTAAPTGLVSASSCRCRHERAEDPASLAADDQRVVREGLAMLLGLLPDVEVVGTAADGEEALALAGELRPDVILMDLRMPKDGRGGGDPQAAASATPRSRWWC